MNQKYDRQDDESGNELEAAAMVDLARTIEQRPQLAGRDDSDSDGEPTEQEDVVTSKNAHEVSSAAVSPSVIGS